MFESNEPKLTLKNPKKITEEPNILPSEKVDMPGDYVPNNPEMDLNVPMPEQPDYIRGDFSFEYPKNIWETLQTLNDNLESKL